MAERPAGAPTSRAMKATCATPSTQIQRDLREQYLVAYSPKNKARDGSYRRIEIQVVNPALKQQNLKLNYRAGYFAKTATPSQPPGNASRTSKISSRSRLQEQVGQLPLPAPATCSCTSSDLFDRQLNPSVTNFR